MKSSSKFALMITTSILLTGCASVDGYDDLSFAEKMRRLYTSNIEFYLPPAQTKINQFNDIILIPDKELSPVTLGIVESKLMKAQISGHPYFKSISKEMAAQETTAEEIDDATGILKIKSTPVEVSTRSFQARRDRCFSDKTAHTCSGEDSFFQYVSCEGIYARQTATYEVENMKHEIIIPKSNVKTDIESEICSDESGSLMTRHQIIEKAQKIIGYRIARKLTPKILERPNDLITSLNIEDKDIEKSAKDLRKQASKGDLVTPLESYIELSKQAPDNASLLFNIGYLYQATGNYEQAQIYLEKAKKLGFEDEDLLEKHLKEVNNWLNKGVSQLSTL